MSNPPIWSKLSPLTRWLMVLFTANIVIVNGALFALPHTAKYDVPLYETYKMLRFRTTADSWEPMDAAWQYLRDAHDEPVYEAIFFDQDVKFQYPLTSLLPVAGAHRLFGADEFSYEALDAVSFVAVLLTAVFTALILELSIRKHLQRELQPRSRAEWALLMAIAFAATLTFYPVVKAFTLGQVQTWINCLFAVTLYLWMRDQRTPAGFVAGVMCVIKPQMGLLLLWGVIRRQWGFAAALAITAAGFVVISLAIYGIEDNWDYFSVLRYISRRGEVYYANQSVNGLLNRLMEPDAAGGFTAGAFPEYDPVVYAGTLATSLVLVGAALAWRWNGATAGSTADFMVAALTTTIASPIAWEHHYGVLAPMFAVLIPMLVRQPVWGSWTMPAIAGAYVLTSTFIFETTEAAGTVLTPVQSYVLFGALVLLATIYRLRWVQEAVESDERIEAVVAATASG